MSLSDEVSVEAPAAKLSIKGVSKRFVSGKRSVHALDDVSLDVGEGEFVCLVGPSGCGKSTLLNLVAGLDLADSGQISADGIPINAPGRDRMVMFQEAALFPWLDVLGNVMFGLRRKPGLTDAERCKVAEFYLRLVGLEKFHRAFVHELSGGMKQRVAIARTLAYGPQTLLMDEPFGALDAHTRTVLQNELLSIWEQDRKTVLFVTHAVDEAVYLSDRVFVMTGSPGRQKALIDIDLPRPRVRRELLLNRRYQEYVIEIERLMENALK